MANEIDYDEFIRMSQALQDATIEDRVMYYFVYSWWRHPVKRLRQWRLLRYIDHENKSRS
jgi:hypothetical protein